MASGVLIRRAVAGDEQKLFALIGELARYERLAREVRLYLENLFVLEGERRRGIGRALLTEVKGIARERGAGRLEWTVLDWNESAIAFYRGFGADVLPDWRLCRVRFTTAPM